jgi:hypothetical protein
MRESAPHPHRSPFGDAVNHTTRTHPRSLSEAFASERAYCIECPQGTRMGLRIKTRPSVWARLWRWLFG